MPLQLDDFLQPGPEASKVAGRAGGDPLGLGQRGRASQFLDQGARQPDTAVVASADFADVHGGRRCWLGDEVRALDDREQLADPGIGRPLMVEAGKQAHLGRAMPRASVGHERLLVPSQERRARAQQQPARGRDGSTRRKPCGRPLFTADATGRKSCAINQDDQHGNLLGGKPKTRPSPPIP